MTPITIRPRVDVTARARIVLEDPRNIKYRKIIKKYINKAETIPTYLPKKSIIGKLIDLFKPDVEHVIRIDVRPNTQFLGKVDKHSFPYLDMKNMYIRKDKVVGNKRELIEEKPLFIIDKKNLLDLISLG